MNSSLFSKSFAFHKSTRGKYQHHDIRNGAPMHFLAYMMKGRCEIVSKYHTIKAKAGDLFYIPMNLPYQSYWYGEPDTILISLGFTFFQEANKNTYYLQKIDASEEIKTKFADEELISGINSKVTGKFYTLLSDVLPFMQHEEISKDERIVSDALEYMWANPNKNANDIARYVNISETALYLAFKKVKGTTPNYEKQKILSKKAQLLLTTTDKSIQEISDALGFSSTSYFRKILKKTLGLTPNEIRKNNYGI